MLYKHLTSFLFSGVLKVKYKIKKASKEYLYAIVIVCPMIMDFWKTYNYDFVIFGKFDGIFP
jgi:hypothetical protein